METKEKVRISKLMAYILRHTSKIDEKGFININDLLKEIKKVYPWIEKKHIEEIVESDEKGRYEIKNGKIRDIYGHSLRVFIDYEEDLDSKFLYHGSTRRNLNKILKEGIKAMGRQFVHLSIDKKNAYETGKRHGKDVVIFIINADCLRRKGYKIYKAGKFVRLVKYVPSDCIYDFA